MPGAGDIQGGGSTGVPAHQQAGKAGMGERIEGHITDQAAQQALAVGGGSVQPAGRQIGSQVEDGLAIRFGKRRGLLDLELEECFLQRRLLLETVLPGAFELSGHQAVVGIDALVAAAGQIGIVAGAFEALAPVSQPGLAVNLDLVESGKGGLQAGWFYGLEEESFDRRVDVGGGEGLAAGITILLGGMVAHISAGVGVVDVQQAPAARTDGNALQQGQPFAGRAALPLDACRILGQAQLVGLEGVPGNVAREGLRTQHGPFGLRQGMG